MTQETEDIERQLRERREAGGASIRMEDGRLSKVRDWVWGLIGAGIVGGTLLAANNLYQLNIAVNRMSDNNAAVAVQLADHEARVRQLEREVNTLAGRNLRGGPEKQEVPRAR